jgi:ribosomal protein L7/L12
MRVEFLMPTGLALWSIVAVAIFLAVTLLSRRVGRVAPTELPVRELATEERERVLGLWRNGGMIEAIKLHRELTGSGLAAAKRAVEAMQGD